MATRKKNAYKDFQNDRVTLCPDGVYRWVYEYPMLKNLTLLFTIWKVLALAGCFPALLVMVCDIGSKGFQAVIDAVQVLGIVLAIMGILSVIAYFILAAMYGWKYIVLFEMNEDGILHLQQRRQFDKAKKIGIVLTILGVLSGKPSAAGRGLLVATNNSTHSSFPHVKKIVGKRKQNVIKVNEFLSKNQVYVKDEDYDFVWNYITSRCPNAKVK